MKKRIVGLVYVVLMVIAFSSLFGFKSYVLAAEEIYKWKVQTAYPLSSSVTNHAIEWAKAIQNITNDRLQMSIHPSGSFCSPAEDITFLRRGSFDASITYGGYYVGILPEANLEACMPMAFRSIYEVWDFMYMRGFQEIIQESYAKKGVRYWGAPSDCYYGIGTNFPIESIADIAGKKIRATGLIGRFLEKLGASVTVIPGSELYMALKLGTIDGAVYGGGTIIPEKMYEVMKYWVQYPTLGHTNAALFVSLKSLNKLPSDLRAVVENSTRYIMLDTALQYFKQSEDMRLKLEELGTKMIYLPEKDVEKMTLIAQTLWDDIAESNNACTRGVEILKKQLKEYGRLK